MSTHLHMHVPTVLDEKKDYFITRGGVQYAGIHLILDLYGAQRLNDAAFIEETLRKCIKAAGATLLHIHLHPFEPDGVSGVAVLAESHISVHTWPESGYAAFDVFMCGNTKPEACIEIMRGAFKPDNLVVTEHLRGKVDGAE
ncbi:adenosylmethionine decarboxylase [Kordiimonas aquimaris]|uniref:adenosylmethionine decarboxylase n=1 Tax=Kordiimonas aquimaris TaxID=707591 RepID=UPI0021D0416D|nr:adenosylmethionine decarboxylase [Kordiimonas aquimaris]